MEGGDLGAQGQPQPCASLLTGTALVHPIKGFGQVVQGVRRHAAAVVLHGQYASVLCKGSVQPYVSAMIQGFPSVIQQIEQQGMDQITFQAADTRRTAGVQADARLSVLGTQRNHQVGDKLLEGYGRSG